MMKKVCEFIEKEEEKGLICADYARASLNNT